MITEIIGVAGSGKSTLSQALSSNFDNVCLVLPPNFKKAQDIPFFINNTFALLPFMPDIISRKNGPYPSRLQLVHLVILNGWHRILSQKALKGGPSFILDQGPVFMLMMLTLYGAEALKSKSLQKYWERVYHCWADTLDTVIWLDAPSALLVERIRGREIWHGVKDKSDEGAYRYLESYRQAFEVVISRLVSCSDKLRVIRLDTGINSLDKTVEKVAVELHLDDGGKIHHFN